MNRHPLSAAFPSFSAGDLDSLVEDIRQFGQRESGLIFEGMVLDGWNRYQACERLGIEFNYLEFEYEFPDVRPENYVLSKNLHRRHMTDSQRAASVVAVSSWVPAGRPNNLAQRANLATNAELANRADVSERTISRAKVAHEAGLGAAVIAGDMTLRQAEEAVKAKRAPTIQDRQRSATHEKREVLEGSAPIATRPSSCVDTVEDSSTDDDDPFEEIERLQKRVSVLTNEIDALTATDQGAEIHKLTQLLINAEARIESFEEKLKALAWFGNKFAEMRRLLNVKTDRDVVAQVRLLKEVSK